MVYLGTWVRRSNVLTGAEWMRTRFGKNLGSELAYLSVVVYALVSVVGFLNLSFQGIGRFTKPFLPWDVHPHYCAVVIMLVAGTYCVVGGMYSVILNDVIQLVLKVVAVGDHRRDRHPRHHGRATGAGGPRRLGQPVLRLDGWAWTGRSTYPPCRSGSTAPGATATGCSACSFRPCSSRACW